MSPRHTPLPYEIDGIAFDSVLVTEPDTDPRATVLVLHGMEGRSDAQLAFAERLAALGYRAVAVDVFGAEAGGTGLEAGAEVMNRFLADRDALHQRLDHVMHEIRSADGVAGTAVAAMGFCFGGLCVLDLARTGHDLRGVVAFHGLLTPPPPRTDAPEIVARIAVYHGWDDPFATPDDVVALGAELSGRGIDWQLHAYGNAMHAFMAPMADAPERGIQYDETTADRAWESAVAFLREVFAGS